MSKNRRTEILFDSLRLSLGWNILDVGNLGDRGIIHEAIIEQAKSATVFGLDIVKQETLGKKYRNQYVGKAEDMPFQDGLFDLVYLGEVIEHTWHPYEVLRECARVLKNGGLLILDTPNIYSLSRMIRYMIRGADYILGEPSHKIFFSRAVMDNILVNSGFQVLDVKSDRKFTIKGKTFILPNLGPLIFMGEHLLYKAQVLER